MLCESPFLIFPHEKRLHAGRATLPQRKNRSRLQIAICKHPSTFHVAASKLLCATFLWMQAGSTKFLCGCNQMVVSWHLALSLINLGFFSAENLNQMPPSKRQSVRAKSGIQDPGNTGSVSREYPSPVCLFFPPKKPARICGSHKVPFTPPCQPVLLQKCFMHPSVG